MIQDSRYELQMSDDAPEQPMHALFFVIGASGAGKTKTVEAVAKRRPDIGFRYFDAIDIPSPQLTKEAYASGEEWQRQMTFAWVRHIKATLLAQIPVVLDGQTRQSYIVEACAAAGITRYKIILFHCRQAERERRLISRGHPELVNAKMENWANYLRDQAVRRGDAIIDTTGLSPQQALDALQAELGKRCGLT